MMRILTTFFLLFSLSSFAQVDFSEYTTLVSKGDIPSDFTTHTYTKLKQDVQSNDDILSYDKEVTFYKNINYAIDEILHSGSVTYGDDVTNYVNSIVERLLKDNDELKSKLRFYTLKSNEANAFSTEQGIVFVTTGLIAHLTSEAQLAFILAHEISHYTNHHVLETFNYSVNNHNQSISQLSTYSKSKEFEADIEGLKMYHNAGYAIDEIIPTFDMLMYSYLPFDEVKLESSYFKNGIEIPFPENLLPTKKYDIKTNENEDDSRSSHPNIKSRKDAIRVGMDSLNNWGDVVFFQGESRFIEIRTIARFEYIRACIMQGNYADALYAIFLLEKDVPNSKFLGKMKAQTWLGILMYSEKDLTHKITDNEDYWEGESAAVHLLVQSLSKSTIEVFALRQIYDIHIEFPESEEVKLIWDRTIETIVVGEHFNRNSFSKRTFKEESIRSFKKDSTVLTADSTAFEKYLIPDVITSPIFNSSYAKSLKEYEKTKKEKARYDDLTLAQQRLVDRKENAKRLHLEIKKLIVVEPIVASYKKGKLNKVKSEKLSAKFIEAIEDAAKSANLDTEAINSKELANQGTPVYNDRSILNNLLFQLSCNDYIDPFPVDYQLLQQIEKNYGTSKVMYTVVDHSNGLTFSGVDLFAIIMYPIAPIYFPLKLFMTNKTGISTLILDISDIQLLAGETHVIRDNARKHIIGAHLYDIFKELGKSK